ncbi:protein angel homolog 2 isoform X2 [Pseudophryne corroboree]|uniref:protein angel homolog 2 isoform X2 n=1 Tax=Pseudophryne corroboree TaxID=495146 RepID=UPI003081A731
MTAGRSFSGSLMLPRHLHCVGSRYMARAGPPQPPFMTSNLFRCPRWTGQHPSSPYPPTITQHPLGQSRPYNWCAPQRTATCGTNSCPWFPPQPSWIQVSYCNMSSAGDESFRKRRKNTEAEDWRQKSWPKRSYPPANDLRVPPKHGSSEVTDPKMEVKASVMRRWEDFSHLYPDRPVESKFDFTVMSYNILSQDLLEDNCSLYSHCRRPYLFWNYRLPNILHELQEMNADILCLQEVQENHYQEQIKPSLEALGYCCVYKSRTGNKPDGCAICFKTAKFTLKLVKPVEYFRHNISLLDRDNVGLVLMLQPKTERCASSVCVANTHLLYNPRRGDIKLAQLAILLAEITEVARMQDGNFCPIVLCGDFNSVPGSPLHRFIKEGTLQYAGMTIGKVSGQELYPRGQRILSIPIWPDSLGINHKCVYEACKDGQTTEPLKEEATKDAGQVAEVDKRYQNRVESSLQHHFQLSSVYSHFFPDTGLPEVTTCHSRSAVTVDYIFYSAAKNNLFTQPGSSVPCNGLQLLGRLLLLTEQDLWSLNGLPNETNSSDHLSLLARFRLEV